MKKDYNDENPDESLWSQICANIPKQEVDEIEKVVGKLKIEENKNLWRELKAFNSIVTEMSMLQFDYPLNDAETFNERQKKSHEVIPILTLKQNMGNIIPNTLLIDTDVSVQQTTSRFVQSPAKFIAKIKRNLNVGKIDSVIMEIETAFQQEKNELESEISLLTRAMESEVDSMEQMKTPNKSKIEDIDLNSMKSSKLQISLLNKCRDCGCPLEGSNNSSSHSSHSNTIKSFKSDLTSCADCKDKLRKAKKLSGRLSKTGAVPDAPISAASASPSPAPKNRPATQQQKRSESAPVAEEKSPAAAPSVSKFKTKLLIAKDTKHFMDD